jgi:hypothetical protein
MEYELYATPRLAQLPGAKSKTKTDPFKNQYAPFRYRRTWSVVPPIHVHAMILSGEHLFVAGPPDPIDEKPALGIARGATGDLSPEQMQTALAAFEGRQGGILWTLTKAGKKLGEYKLEAPPRFDGMAAAYGALYLACSDGSLVCLAGE